MKKCKELLLTFIFAFVGMTALAQTTVTGKVIDAEGLEVIGCSVTVDGSKGVGTVTDIDGNYTIRVNNPAKDALVFSFVGMTTVKEPVANRSVINVTMRSSAVALDEVVAIGYATTKRRDLTGSVASVGAKELAKVPVSDVTQALAGRMAGVMVNRSEGAPGSDISIRVRGGISITQSNEPLYIIDGFPSEDGMSSLDPAEIETIDVLKDASSTAIYGARGANGVVVITTKQGSKNGQNTVTFDSYIGFNKIAKKLDVLNPYEFTMLDYERRVYKAADADQLATNIGTFEGIYGPWSDLQKNYGNRAGLDWQDETLGRTAMIQNYRIGVSGGDQNMNYALSYSYFDEDGAMVYSGNKKHNISLSFNKKIKNWLTVHARANYDQMKIEGMGTSGNSDRFNKMQHILQYRPTIGINGVDTDLLGDEDPMYMDDTGNVMQNPLLSAAEETTDREFRTLQINGGFTINLMKGLTFRNSTGYRHQDRRYDTFYGDKSMTAKRSSINGTIETREYGSFQTSNTLNYNWKYKKHDLNVMLGQEYVDRWTRTFSGSAGNFPNDDIGLADMSLGLPTAISTSENYDDKLLSFFGRVSYNFDEKYLLTATLRADGSSKFGKNNKWGWFPSVSAAWRLIEEDFIRELGVFSDLKLRAGYGSAGNNRINSYLSLAILNSVTYPTGDSTQSGYVSAQIPNPDLKWEANKTFNLGLDMGFFQQRLTISPEFYINRSSNLLLNAKLPDSSGYSSMVINAGETENMGVDLTINSVNITNRDFEWTTALTLSHNKNTVKKLTGEDVQLWEAKFGYNQNTHMIGVNQPLGQMYGYVTDGLYQVSDFDYDAATQTYTLKDGIPYLGDKKNVQPGHWKFKNIDGSEDNKITEDDKTVIGHAYPKFYGGLNNNFTYKGFDLSVFFTFSYGNDVFNATKLTNTKTANNNTNVLDVADMAHRWTIINQNGQRITDPNELAEVNRGKTFAAITDNEVGDTYIHSWAVEDGSYLKLSNVTFGYTFPKRWISKIGLSKLRLYATGSNLWTWTKYSGFDPEVSTMGNGLTPGVDFGGYPKSRSFVFGINVAF